MVNWLIVLILVVVLLWFFKARRMQHKIYAVLIVVLLIFFYTSFSNVINNNEVDVKTFDGMVTAGKLYFSWLGNAVKNVGSLAGNAIKMDWAGNITGK